MLEHHQEHYVNYHINKQKQQPIDYYKLLQKYEYKQKVNVI